MPKVPTCAMAVTKTPEGIKQLCREKTSATQLKGQTERPSAGGVHRGTNAVVWSVAKCDRAL